VARTGSWYRHYEPLADGLTSAGYHTVQLVDPLVEGQTITRIRFRYQCVHTQDFGAQEATGLGVCMGIAVLPRFDQPADYLAPVAGATTTDWLWWEAPFFVPVLGASMTGVVAEADIAPYPDQYRDCHAQRLITEDSTLWLVTQVQQVVEAQSEHYLSVSASTYVLDPA